MKKKNLVNSAEITKQSMSRKWMHITRQQKKRSVIRADTYTWHTHTIVHVQLKTKPYKVWMCATYSMPSRDSVFFLLLSLLLLLSFSSVIVMLLKKTREREKKKIVLFSNFSRFFYKKFPLQQMSPSWTHIYMRWTAQNNHGQQNAKRDDRKKNDNKRFWPASLVSSNKSKIQLDELEKNNNNAMDLNERRNRKVKNERWKLRGIEQMYRHKIYIYW